MVVKSRTGLAILAASVPMFMVSLNNLVVINALPEIGFDFVSNTADLQWVVNTYILAFAGLLLTGAALGDRFGRRRVFAGAILLFTVGSVVCALSGSIGTLIVGRVIQGMGAAAVQPLSLALVTATVPAEKRGMAIGLWGGVNGLGIAIGPLIGGAVTQGVSWQWIFWINVPVALAGLVLVRRALPESTGQRRGLDLIGMLLATSAVTFAVWAIVRAAAEGWTSPHILGAFGAVAVLLVLFAIWERQAATPLLPMHFYRTRVFVLSNLVSVAMFFGVFGSIFFITQYLQGPLTFSPLGAGLRMLPWTAMPMLVAPVVGVITDQVGGGRLMSIGLALQGAALALIALIATVGTAYSRLAPVMVLAGIGMGLALAPTMIVVLSSVGENEHAQASGANNTLREVGGALGVAVLSTVFQSRLGGGVSNPIQVQGSDVFVAGMTRAIWLGVVVVMAGAVAAALIERQKTAVLPSVDVTRSGERTSSPT